MAIKITRTGLFNRTFDFVDGSDTVGKLRVGWFGISDEANFELSIDNTVAFYREPISLGKFKMHRGSIPIALAIEDSPDYPNVNIKYSEKDYFLRRDSQLGKTYSLFHGKIPCGSIYKDDDGESYATLNVIKGLPKDLLAFCFWIIMFYWRGRGIPSPG